jgi:hypothetical protein
MLIKKIYPKKQLSASSRRWRKVTITSAEQGIPTET